MFGRNLGLKRCFVAAQLFQKIKERNDAERYRCVHVRCLSDTCSRGY